MDLYDVVPQDDLPQKRCECFSPNGLDIRGQNRVQKEVCIYYLFIDQYHCMGFNSKF